MAQGYGLTSVSSSEVVSAYAAGPRAVPVIQGGSIWVVIGEFFLPLSASARLEAIGCVSQAGLTANVRLFDMTTKAPIDSAATLTSTAPVRALSATMALTGGRTYQIQAQCVGAVDEANFALIQTAALTN